MKQAKSLEGGLEPDIRRGAGTGHPAPLPQAHPQERLLIVVAPESRLRVQRILKDQGYQADSAEHWQAARELLADGAYDAVVAELDDVAAAQDVLGQQDGADTDRALILLTHADHPHQARLALALGARGLLHKPVNEQELLFSVNNALTSLRLARENRAFNHRLQSEVLRQTKELLNTIQRLERVELGIRRSHEETVLRLARATEYRDNETGRHLQRMSHYSALLARQSGWDFERCELIRIASPMHDVGKIGIPDQILYKNGKHTPEEFEIMKQHSQIGYEILAGSQNDLLDLAALIAWTHHEKWDGRGYPRGLAYEAIPLEGRIVAIADVFDALTSKRVYKPAFPSEQAQSMMLEGSAGHFDPHLLEMFFSALPEVLDIKMRYSDPEA